MRKSRKVPKYTVYDNKTDECICVCESANRCAEIMGVKLDTFYHSINNARGNTRGNRWTVLKEGCCEEMVVSEVPNPKTIGEFIRRCRKQKGYKQGDVSKATGIARVSISRYERNVQFPTLMNLISMADFLNVSIDELIGRR